MLEHIFDPALKTQPVTVKVNPGQILVGETNFLEPGCVYGLDLSPIQAAKLVLVLTKAIEAELRYSEDFEKYCKGGGGHEFL